MTDIDHEHRRSLREFRPRRTSLAVPGSSPRMLAKAAGLAPDQVFLDLEDSVAPSAKAQARDNVVQALRTGNFAGKIRVVRVNDWSTPWTHQDLATVVDGAGEHIDAIMLPKVQSAGQVEATDLLLTQLERANGLPVGRIGLEVQIEDALGLSRIDAVAGASQRLETLIFGPGDLAADLNMTSLVVGGRPAGYPGDAFHHILMTILVAARAHGLQAIDGPMGLVRDPEAFRESAAMSAALGLDGKWVLHPDQIVLGNDAFTPSQERYDEAEEILAAYAWYTSDAGGSRGAAMVGDNFIDEASHKMARVTAMKGRKAGLSPSRTWAPPEPVDA